MHALFEEAGKFLAGRILSEADTSAQVELDSGKRVKVKAAHILLKFEKPAPAELIAQAQAVAETIELDLAWEFAPEDEFGFADLARDYFSENATLIQQAGALFRLYDAPHYFRRAGKGRFKKASAEILQQALAAIEKKKAILAQIDEWAAALGRGECPQPIPRPALQDLVQAGQERARIQGRGRGQPRHAHRTAGPAAKSGRHRFGLPVPLEALSVRELPQGTGFPAVTAPAIADELPLSTAQAYSIDDSQTTEIDDALSVQGLGTGTVVLGIHIAAPGLAIQPGSAIDQLGRARLSTVYMPGYKITMLPDDVVQTYTLDEGRANPAVSLYVNIDETTLEFKGSETRLERVHVAANLRHDQLDAVVTEEWLSNPAFEHQNDPQRLSELRPQLSFLHRLAKDLKARREVVRGKPENFNRRTTTSAWSATTVPSPRAMNKCRSACASAARRSTSSWPRP